METKDITKVSNSVLFVLGGCKRNYLDKSTKKRYRSEQHMASQMKQMTGKAAKRVPLSEAIKRIFKVA